VTLYSSGSEIRTYCY